MPGTCPPAPDLAAIAHIIDARQSQAGALLPILHAIQDAVGYVPDAAVPQIASALNLSRAEVHGVITYYHDFRTQPAGQHRVQVCRAEACQARGAEALAAHVSNTLDCAFDTSRDDGTLTLEACYCLGHCSVGPNITIDGQQHARVTPARFDRLIATARQVS